jgi:hypothetical protein
MQDFENMENDRRQILEETAELDHIWGVWEAEAQPISDAAGWLQQASLNRTKEIYGTMLKHEYHTGNNGGSHRQRR